MALRAASRKLWRSQLSRKGSASLVGRTLGLASEHRGQTWCIAPAEEMREWASPAVESIHRMHRLEFQAGEALERLQGLYAEAACFDDPGGRITGVPGIAAGFELIKALFEVEQVSALQAQQPRHFPPGRCGD